MILRLAWKNIWRNKLRSSIIMGAIALGLFAGTFTTAFINGWMGNTVLSDIKTQLSYIQIHQPEFADNNDISAFFMQDTVEDKIKSVPNLNNVSYRLKINGMLASAANAVGVSVKGVDVEKEKATSTLYQSIPDSLGSFLSGDGKMQIVISRKTAEKLKVKLKSKIVLTIQDANGEMQSVAFRVGGIFKTTNSAFDENMVFVKKSDITPYTGLPEGAVHEAAVMVNDFETCKLVLPQLKKQLVGMDVQSWDELQPALNIMLSWTDMMTVVILSIFLLALSFGIVNTMLMAVLERTHELGMLACIGMNKGRIFRMILSETLLLTGLGSFVGILFGSIVITLTAKNGIDLSFFLQDQFEDYGFGSIVYPVMDMKNFIEIVVLVILAGILSSIYPARKALKLDPLEAIRS